MLFLHLHAACLPTLRACVGIRRHQKLSSFIQKQNGQRTPKTRPSTISLASFSSCLFVDDMIYIFIHLWLASTTHKGQQVQPNHFFSSAKKKEKENEATRTILSITQRYLSFRCLVWVPRQPKQQSMGLMNLFCGGHGIHTLRTVVIWATTDSVPSTPLGVGPLVLLSCWQNYIHSFTLLSFTYGMHFLHIYDNDIYTLKVEQK